MKMTIMTEQERFNTEQEILSKLKRICERPSHYPFDPEKVMEVEKEAMQEKIEAGLSPYNVAKEMCFRYLYKVRYHLI